MDSYVVLLVAAAIIAAAGVAGALVMVTWRNVQVRPAPPAGKPPIPPTESVRRAVRDGARFLQSPTSRAGAGVANFFEDTVQQLLLVKRTVPDSASPAVVAPIFVRQS